MEKHEVNKISEDKEVFRKWVNGQIIGISNNENVELLEDDSILFDGDKILFVLNSFYQIFSEFFDNEFVIPIKKVNKGDFVYVLLNEDDCGENCQVLGIFSEEPNDELLEVFKIQDSHKAFVHDKDFYNGCNMEIREEDYSPDVYYDTIDYFNPRVVKLTLK